jgi:hypothetical protein
MGVGVFDEEAGDEFHRHSTINETTAFFFFYDNKIE